MDCFFQKFRRIVLLYLLLFAGMFSLDGGPQITIGTNTFINTSLPYNPYYKYSLTQSIFLKSDINVSYPVFIDSIAFNYNGNSAITDTFNLYLGHTSKSSYSSTSDWISNGACGLFYSGEYSVSASTGWYKFALDNPFYYNNIDNLVVFLDENGSSSHTSSDDYYATSQGTDRSLFYRSDATNPSHSSPPTGTLSSYCPNIRLYVRPAHQLIVGVGVGGTITKHVPIEPYYKFTYSENIYLPTELNLAEAISIDSIFFSYYGAAWTDAIVINMDNTSTSSFSSNTDWETSSGMTQVYSGDYTVGSNLDWYGVKLDNNFIYNNSDNLVIAVDENTDGYHANSDEFVAILYSSYRSLYYYSDETNPSPSSPPTSGDYLARTLYRPSLRLQYSFTKPIAGSGNCLRFDGADDFVQVNSTGATGTNGFTLEFWIKPNSPADAARIVLQGSDARATRQLAAAWDGTAGQIDFVTATGSSSTPQAATTAITNDNSTWTHVAWTFDGTSTHNVYVNGSSSAGTASSSNYYVDGPFCIGARDGDASFFAGCLDEVRLWTDVRTQSEIQNNMYEALTGTEENLILNFQFDEPGGGIVFDNTPVQNNGGVYSATREASEAWKSRSTDDDTPLRFCAGHDPDGGTLTLSESSAPTSGSLIFDNSNNDVIYVPDINATGADNFTYQVSDGSNSDTYAMTVTNTNVNMAPIAGSGNCLAFDGTNEYILLPDGGMITGATYTLEFWIKPNDPADGTFRRIFIQGADYGSRQLVAAFKNDHIECYTTTSGSSGTPQIATGTITNNNSTWTHVAWTYNGSTHTIYVNGQSTSGSSTTTNLGISGGNYIGCYNGNDKYFKGSLDDIRLWSDVRTQSEIQDYRYTALVGNEANLVGYWRFDEPSGEFTRDYSGDDHHGILKNMESGDFVNCNTWKYRTMATSSTLSHSAGFDPDGDALTITESGGPTTGLTFDNANRECDYSSGGSGGTITYTYQVSDAKAKATDTYDMEIIVSGDENYDDWNYNQTLYLNTTSSGANVSENVRNFPLCVRLDTTNFRFGQAESDGTDIRFSKSDGTHLFYEREQWTLSTDDSVAVFWVLLDTVYGNNSTQSIKMYWGNSSCGDSSVSDNVFQTSAEYDFAAVWHLGSNYNDATSNNNDGSSSGSTDADGICGKAESFDGSNDYVSVSDAASLDLTSQVTLSAWINADEWETNEWEGSIINKDATSPSDLGYALRTGNNGNVNLTIGNSAWPQATSPSEMNTHSWYHLAGTYDGQFIKVYIDGVLKGSRATSIAIGTNTNDVNIGRSPQFTTTRLFKGTIEEARISSTARSASWIKLCYESQRLAQTLIEWEVYADWNYATNFSINTTSTGADVSSDITDFPLLIRLDTSNFVFADAETNGEDIRFSRNGKHLYYEIERWDNSGEEAEIWVRVDTIFGDDASQSITMHFGKSGVLNWSKGDRVFDVSEGFAGTWHLGASNFSDITWHGNDGTNNGSADVDGTIGKGKDFEGEGVGDYVNVPYAVELAPTKKLTLNLWAYDSDWTTTWDGSAETIVGKIEGGGWDINRTTTIIQARVYRNSARADAQYTHSGLSSGWHLFTCVYDGRYTKLYVDGDSVVANDAGASYDIEYGNNNSLIIGGDPDATVNPETYFQGYLDEVRVSSQSRSSDWIKLCYETQKADQSVVTTDAVELLPLTINHNIGNGISDTLEIRTTQWKIIFDEDLGAGIKWLSNEATGTGTNQLDINKNLFYVRANGINAHLSSGVLTLLDSSNLFCGVLQEITIDGQPWEIEYTVYGTGRLYIRVSTEALWQAYDPALGMMFRIYSNVVNKEYFNENATASQANYFLHADKAKGRFDILFALYEDWSQASDFTNTSNDYYGIKDDDWQIAAGQKQIWEFMIDFAHKDWDDTTGIGKYVDDYRDIDSLEFTKGRLRMDKAWEEQLIGHWTFDEGSAGSADGATVGDSSLGNHTGTIEGGTWGDGQIVNGVVFDGNDSVALASASDFNTPYAFTIAAWIKKSGTGETDDMVFGKFNPTTGEGYKLYSDANVLKAKIYNLSLTGATALGTGWRHVALTSNHHSGYHKLYVDGKPDAVLLGQATIKTSSLSASIGNSFSGTIDDVRFFTQELSEGSIRALAQNSYRVGNGMYMVRTDNNNTVDLTIDGTGSQPEYFPIFQIVNYWATTAPKAVYYDGQWLATPKDYLVNFNDFQNTCVIGFNRRVTKSNLRIYIDESDSSGAYMTGPMPILTYGNSGSDYYVKNTSSTSFGTVGSNEFYLYWKMDNSSGFGGELWEFKSSESEPSEAISSADNIINTATSFTFGYHDHFGTGGNYASSATEISASASYTVLEASDTRIRLQIDERTAQDATGIDYDITSIWTIYPTGQIFRYDTLDNLTAEIDYEFIRFRMDYEDGTSYAKDDGDFCAVVYNTTNAHDHVLALLDGEDKNGVQLVTAASSGDTIDWQDDGSTYMGCRFLGGTNRTNSVAPLKYAFYIDIRHQNMDANYRDSIVDPMRTIATVDADMITGDLVDTAEGDLDADGFCEAEGAYILRASDNSVHFNLDADGATDGCQFNPAFRIINYTADEKPRYVKMYTTADTITLIDGYTYNSYVNTSANELIMQLDTVLCNDVKIYVNYDDDLAVTLSNFYARSGDGNDTLFWRTESESQNLGFWIYRRIVPTFYDSLASAIDSTTPESNLNNAGLLYKRGQLAIADTQWMAINKKLIPGADGGTSHGPIEYLHLDFGVQNHMLYEYKLAMVDMSLETKEHGPVSVMPRPILPGQFMLFHNFPNPVKHYTLIRFDLPEKSSVSLNVYNLQGRLVSRLVRPGKKWKPGFHRVRWNCRDELGRKLASGPYIYRLQAGTKYAKSRLMILLK